MKYFIIACLLLLPAAGCRFSVSAEKLQLHVAIDQTAYLGKEDPTTYTDEPANSPNSVE